MDWTFDTVVDLVMDYADARDTPVKNATAEKFINLVTLILTEHKITFDKSRKDQKITWSNYLKCRLLLYPDSTKITKAKILSIEEISIILTTLENSTIQEGYRGHIKICAILALAFSCATACRIGDLFGIYWSGITTKLIDDVWAIQCRRAMSKTDALGKKDRRLICYQNSENRQICPVRLG